MRYNYFAYVIDKELVINFDSHQTRLECKNIAQRHSIFFEITEAKCLTKRQIDYALNDMFTFCNPKVFEIHLLAGFYRN